MSSLAAAVAASAAVVAALHHIARVVIRTKYKRDDTRWCFVHAVANLIVVYTTHDVVADVRAHLALPERKFPIALAVALHVYHLLCYELSPADRTHHLLFLPTIGIPGALYDWCNIGNVQLFFICGLPGAILYATVVARRVFPAVRSAVSEPILSAGLNLGMRCPGVLASTAWLYWAFNSGLIEAPPFWVLLQCAVGSTNSIFYAYQAATRALRVQSISPKSA